MKEGSSFSQNVWEKNTLKSLTKEGKTKEHGGRVVGRVRKNGVI